jgi:hypothetical protein
MLYIHINGYVEKRQVLAGSINFSGMGFRVLSTDALDYMAAEAVYSNTSVLNN